MSTLTETLQDERRKDAVIRDGAQMIDEEVARRSGLSGMALRTGYKTVKKLKPGMIEAALRSLLPEFAPAVDPHFLKARESGNVDAYFRSNAGPIADALLGVTDARAERAQNRVMKKVYTSLRGQAKGHVMESLPRLAELIERHVPAN
ncbi:MAG: hypothetical protein EP330_30840 [Deltaproteobacteria bacterium]|nr:MAG: hypothetical protein EP330_30840 [Deltaproteobacteria bacterium]